MAAVLQELLEARLAKDQDRYQAALQRIPEGYRHKYHVPLSLTMQFTMTLMDGRRGAEGIELLTKNHWRIIEENGKKYIKKVIISDHFRQMKIIMDKFLMLLFFR